MMKILKGLMSRIVIFSILIILQVVLMIGLIFGLSQEYSYIYGFLEIFGIIVSIWILNSKRNPSYKLTWIMTIVLFPILGGVFYIFFGIRHNSKKAIKRNENEMAKIKKYLPPNKNVDQQLETLNSYIFKHSKYITNFSGYPLYTHSLTKYLSPGEEKFQCLLDEIKKAQKYIFLEYFIISPGHMWNSILNVLEQKVSEGVDVRVIYDDIGCLFKLPNNYHKELQAKGIKCQIFNPLIPYPNVYMNHRDHRKIAIIDGMVAFTGGINLSDEYINKDCKLGYWKDASIMVKGQAAWSMTVMFLQMWNYFKDEDTDFNIFKPQGTFGNLDDGYVQPFADSPLDMENIYENVYYNLIATATRYIYINTPYLIIDNEMFEALITAAKSGVDVKIICPKIPDKKYVYLVSQTFFQELVEYGVKIYTYTPGFLHSKTLLVDDDVGCIGSANMDYRSFYLHYESGVWMYKSQALSELKKDFLSTLKQCELVTIEKCKEISIFVRVFRSLLRIFSPMM